MHQAEVEAGLLGQRQALEREEVGGVVPVARHRQVHPVQRSAQARRDAVGHGRQAGGVGGLHEVPVSEVAVAEVVAQGNAGGHGLAQPDHALDDPGQQPVGVVLAEPRREHALLQGELHRAVPLHRQPVGRDGRGDLGQLGQQACLVGALQFRLVHGGERGHHGDRRGQADLEPGMRGDHAFGLEAGEDRPGLQRGAGIAQVPEHHA
ncbi:hypothetical protein HNR12_005245 [Streptomonospora nanhaiensis]|uniref:Uncharacterized protein n=1 Tax=Streptomonospora nanhaiensis TaxID=1323731 RepID=A0A853BUJ8_9ACTN|nr:hypothetical protein [Streptomonospora nanhaiensis]NYI98968.1 hypothetical protein [Streptomonospora nanhaiensis]